VRLAVVGNERVQVDQAADFLGTRPTAGKDCRPVNVDNQDTSFRFLRAEIVDDVEFDCFAQADGFLLA